MERTGTIRCIFCGKTAKGEEGWLQHGGKWICPRDMKIIAAYAKIK